ncbi:MAG: hypothetical protein DMG30_03340 [Acidobacteria bacterium]|nr:MAG: hypothetical protein DMG30_03340 [Acidobacteriota bacterium]
MRFWGGGDYMKFSYRAVAIAVAAFSFTPGAWAQGCVLCYTSLASSGPTAMHAFQMAMFALLIPALLLFLGVCLLIFRCARTKTPYPAIQRNHVPRRRLSSSIAKPVEGGA